MVLFFYVGGGPRAILASLAISVFSSLLLGGGPTLLWDFGDMGNGSGLGPLPARAFGAAPGGWGPAQQAAGSSVSFWPALSALLVVAAVPFGLRFLLWLRPRWAQHWLVQRVTAPLHRLWERFVDGLLEGLQAGGAGAEGGPGGRRRLKAKHSDVQALPTEVFAPESELQRWSATELKEDLRRLQRLADLRVGCFAGGSAAREMHRLLRGGGAVEKPELVKVVLKARGGDSGQSCAVCLAAYESGARLRMLPCGHRFHANCVDRWLVEQSRTCPLCSKSII